MRVLLHVQSTLGNQTGIGHHTLQLHRCLNQQAPGEILTSPPGLLRRLHRRLNGSGSVARRAGFLLTRAVIKGYPSLRPMKQEEVTPTLRQLGLPDRYLLHVGTIEPRKNVLTLMRAYCDLPAALRDCYPLILAGGWGWRAEQVAAFFHDEARHKNV